MFVHYYAANDLNIICIITNPLVIYYLCPMHHLFIICIFIIFITSSYYFYSFLYTQFIIRVFVVLYIIALFSFILLPTIYYSSPSYFLYFHFTFIQCLTTNLSFITSRYIYLFLSVQVII